MTNREPRSRPFSNFGSSLAVRVEVLVEGDEVRVMHDGAEVALHRLQPPGGASIQDGHYPTPPPNQPRPRRRRPGLNREGPVTAIERTVVVADAGEVR